MQAARDYTHKALEMTMRDVLDSLEDAASYMALHSTPEGLEILSIEAPGRDPYAQKQRAQVIPLGKT
ncbi:MAG: hypothetical protein PVJ63_03980 [Thioalkalispiraceae bacterium]|jgi:hypothetical protein